jgi:hypothetical protein
VDISDGERGLTEETLIVTMGFIGVESEEYTP